jgi:hypothetical protein
MTGSAYSRSKENETPNGPNDMAMKGHDEESQPRSGGCNQSTR